jgi:hypothetical protein
LDQMYDAWRKRVARVANGSAAVHERGKVMVSTEGL